MKNLQSLIAMMVLCVAPHILAAQASVQDLKKYLTKLKNDPTIPVPMTVVSDKKNEKLLMDYLISHRQDGGEEFQFRVSDLVRMIGVNSKNDDVRKMAVNYFITMVPDQNLRVGGLAVQSAVQFQARDFSQTNKDSIVNYLQVNMPQLDVLFRLAAFLEIPAAKEKISSMLNAPISKVLKWNARLALVRLGDEAATSGVLEKIKTSTIDDAFVHSLIPGLVYTRNKKVFAELEKIIQSDAYNCRSSHPESKSTVLCAYRVLENIAGAIDNFPIEVDESGDMLVDNYQSALETARRWFKQNPDYTILRNTM